MKGLSILVAIALFAGADQLAVRLKQADLAPAGHQHPRATAPVRARTLRAALSPVQAAPPPVTPMRWIQRFKNPKVIAGLGLIVFGLALIAPAFFAPRPGRLPRANWIASCRPRLSRPSG